MTDLENHGPTNDDSSRTAVGSSSGERARRWMVHDGVELSVMSQQVRLHLDVYLESTLGKPWVNLKTEPGVARVRRRQALASNETEINWVISYRFRRRDGLNVAALFGQWSDATGLAGQEAASKEDSGRTRIRWTANWKAAPSSSESSNSSQDGSYLKDRSKDRRRKLAARRRCSKKRLRICWSLEQAGSAGTEKVASRWS